MNSRNTFPKRGNNKKRVMGIEPTYPAWKAGVLPLNYTRIYTLYDYNCVGVTGFEPATSWSQTRRSSQAEPHPEKAPVNVPFTTQVILYLMTYSMSTGFIYFFHFLFFISGFFISYIVFITFKHVLPEAMPPHSRSFLRHFK